MFLWLHISLKINSNSSPWPSDLAHFLPVGCVPARQLCVPRQQPAQVLLRAFSPHAVFSAWSVHPIPLSNLNLYMVGSFLSFRFQLIYHLLRQPPLILITVFPCYLPILVSLFSSLIPLPSHLSLFPWLFTVTLFPTHTHISEVINITTILKVNRK